MKSKGKNNSSGKERVPKWAKNIDHGIESFLAIMSPVTKAEDQNYQTFIQKKLKKKIGD